MLPDPTRTAGLIEAVGQRMTIPSRIATAMGRAPRQVRMTVGGQTYYLDAYAERH